MGLFIHLSPIAPEREMAAPGEPWLYSLTDSAAAEDLPVAIGRAGGQIRAVSAVSP